MREVTTVDTIERLDDFLLAATDVCGDELILCHPDGAPAIIRVNGANLVLCWSDRRMDAEIMDDLGILRRAGWFAAHGPRVLRADAVMLRYLCGEPHLMVVRDVPLAVRHVVTHMEVQS